MTKEFLKKVEINSALIIFIFGVLAILFWDGKVLISLIFGGLLGVVNLRWIYKTVRGILEVKSPSRAKWALLFIYLSKLGIISLILIMALKTGRVNIPALLAGFTLVITVIILQGFLFAKRV